MITETKKVAIKNVTVLYGTVDSRKDTDTGWVDSKGNYHAPGADARVLVLVPKTEQSAGLESLPGVECGDTNPKNRRYIGDFSKGHYLLEARVRKNRRLFSLGGDIRPGDKVDIEVETSADGFILELAVRVGRDESFSYEAAMKSSANESLIHRVTRG